MSIVVALLLLILSNSCNLAIVSSLNDEGLALFSFKNSIKQDPENSLNNWNYSDENPCSWNGITCNEQKVVSITIPKRKLVGSLSYTLGSLSELRHVNLRNNNLSGVLPPELFKPQGLQSLVLYGNMFTGLLPFEVGNLKYLQTLDLSQNFLNGSLPISLIQCKRLKNLDLSYNSFSGSLPDKFGTSLGLLEKLDLSHNSIDGSIPSDLGYLSNLQGTLDFSHNTFKGSIPASLGNLPDKVYIDLSYNELSGPIPQNGALVNRGPTAFIGNPNLCGPPLKNPCSSSGNEATPPSSFPYIPSNNPTEGGPKIRVGHGLSKAGLIAIIIGDVIGIILIGLLFSYCYLRVFPNFCKGENGGKGKRNECLCFRKDESETLSERNGEHYDLVALDGHVGFSLDELLKASAFVLGKSGAGIVYKVVLEDGVMLAVRRLGEGGLQRFKEFKIEVEAVGKIKHPNVVTLRAYYWSADEKLLIYDFVPNGNLASAIHGQPGTIEFTPLSWSSRLKIMKGVAKGLLYLHEFSPKKYVHGDLKPTNILLGEDTEPKISDFGLGRLANITGGSPTVQSSRMVSDNPNEVVSFVSSASHYQAPESLKVVKPSQKWDVYSYGVILLEMITGKSPPLVQAGGVGIDLVRWMQICIEEKRPAYQVLDPNLARDADREEEMIGALKIAMACTQASPEKRPSMRSVSDALERLSL